MSNMCVDVLRGQKVCPSGVGVTLGCCQLPGVGAGNLTPSSARTVSAFTSGALLPPSPFLSSDLASVTLCLPSSSSVLTPFPGTTGASTSLGVCMVGDNSDRDSDCCGEPPVLSLLCSYI